MWVNVLPILMGWTSDGHTHFHTLHYVLGKDKSLLKPPYWTELNSFSTTRAQWRDWLCPLPALLPGGKPPGALASSSLVWGQWSRTGAADSRLYRAQGGDTNEHRELESFCTVGRALHHSTPADLCHGGNKTGLHGPLFFTWSQKSRWLKFSSFKWWQLTKHLLKHCVSGSIWVKSVTSPSQYWHSSKQEGAVKNHWSKH